MRGSTMALSVLVIVMAFWTFKGDAGPEAFISTLFFGSALCICLSIERKRD